MWILSLCPVSHIQFLLPPITTSVGYGVHDLRNTGRVQVDYVRGIGIKREHWQRWAAWLAVNGETGDILLECYRYWRAGYRSTWTIEKGVGNLVILERYSLLFGEINSHLAHEVLVVR